MIKRGRTHRQLANNKPVPTPQQIKYVVYTDTDIVLYTHRIYIAAYLFVKVD